MFSFIACGGPSEQQKALEEAGLVESRRSSPEAAAKAAFEIWAQEAGIPYRNERYNGIYNDGTFATIHIRAEFRKRLEYPWLENEAELECKKVAKEWECERRMYFQLTQAERARQQRMAMATATAQAAAWAATATAEALSREATATAETAVIATPEAVVLPQLRHNWPP